MTDTNQYLTFTADGAEYCVPIMAVREINGWVPATRLPNTPSYMCGVINLRGSIVPVFDLRARFTGRTTPCTKMHVTIILAVDGRQIGLLVDSVSDILDVEDDAIRPPGSDRSLAGQDFVTGLLMVEGRIVAILNLDAIFQNDGTDLPQSDVA